MHVPDLASAKDNGKIVSLLGVVIQLGIGCWIPSKDKQRHYKLTTVLVSDFTQQVFRMCFWEQRVQYVDKDCANNQELCPGDITFFNRYTVCFVCCFFFFYA